MDPLTLPERQRIESAMQKAGYENIHDFILFLLDKLKERK